MIDTLRSICITVPALFVLPCVPAFSQDETPASNEAIVELKNGDRVQGELTDDGKSEVLSLIHI